MVITTIPALVAILGGLAYVLSTNAPVRELGRLAFLCGLLALMLTLSHSGSVRIFP